MVNLKIFVVLLCLLQLNCGKKAPETEVLPPEPKVETPSPIQVGAARVGEFVSLLAGKNVAMVVNQTSTIGNTHVVDTLLALDIQIKAIFSPEHGFRGQADAGEKIVDGKDPQTGIPLLSLYGKKRKPSAQDLAGIDWVVFDIQDVGARFYTYISTMHYVMEACAENNIRFMVLDRPNPNGHYVDGPIMEESYQSFVGMHPIPIVHGMTVGEYARMINGEGWLKGGIECPLTVIPCQNYRHEMTYDLPVRPSPNLPNLHSIYLYPSLCFFEGTVASIGRGTNTQFQVIGHPDYPSGDYTFTPKSMFGAKNPKLKGELCNGYDLTQKSPLEIKKEGKLNLKYLMEFYQDFPDKDQFFLKNKWIDKLAGGKHLREQIIAGKTEAEIRASWQPGLTAFKAIREKYLMYN